MVCDQDLPGGRWMRLGGHGRRVVAALALLVVFGIGGCATAPHGPGARPASDRPPLTFEQQRLNMESFTTVWRTIRDRHWDPDLGGLDWQAVHDSLRIAAEGAESQRAFRAVTRKMVSSLGQSHFAIIPASMYDDMSPGSGDQDADGVTGMDVRVWDQRAYVSAVYPGSPAAAAGVLPGWQLEQVRGKDLAPRLESLGLELAHKTTRELSLARAVISRLQGPIGDSLRVDFCDGEGRRITKQVGLMPPRGRAAKFGNLPTMNVWIDTLRVAGNIGYIAFNCFLDPPYVMGTFNRAMQSYRDTQGLIIDLRGNPGGIGAMAMGMAGWFVERKGYVLGTMHTRDGEIRFSLSPRPVGYSRPVAILIDGLSASTAEILAGGLRDLGRARLFGSRTAGAALPSHIMRLPNGDGFQYAVANYISQGGEVLEAVGVAPDVQLRPDPQALLRGQDPVLDAAIAWIGTGHKKETLDSE